MLYYRVTSLRDKQAIRITESDTVSRATENI